MAPCYIKNCILKGTVDYYCLVCETYLKSEMDNIDHIAKPIHKKNLDNTQYMKDFEEDFVRKIKKGYFCELCNKLLPMMSRVKIHVNEPSHIDSKNLTFFKRIGVNVVAFGKVVLNDKAWNGLNDDSCAFCNIEYEDEEIHKNLLTHILNIIQIKVEVDKDKNIYRKIDDVSFQCLTCNMVLALNNITRHFEEDEHKHRYQECCALNKINKNESDATEDRKDNKEKAHEELSDNNIDSPALSLNKTREPTKQAPVASNSDVLVETTAIAAKPLNETGDNEKEPKIAINSVADKEIEDPKNNTNDCFENPLNKTNQNKEDSNIVKDIDVKQQNKNLEDSKVKKNITKINPDELNETKQSGSSTEIGKTRSSSFNIRDYEKKICKILKAEDYIALDENGKTLCILCYWIMDPRNKRVHITGQHHQTMEKLHKKRFAKMESRNKTENSEENNKINKENTKENKPETNKESNKMRNNKGKRKKDKTENNKESDKIENNKEISKEIKTENYKETRVLQNKSVLDMVSEFQENNVSINLIFNTAVCKKCTVNLPYDVNAIEEHILKHNVNYKHESEEILQTCEDTDKETCENTSEVTIKEKNEVGNAERNLNEEKVEHQNVFERPADVNTQIDENSNETSKDESEVIVNKCPVKENSPKQLLRDYVKTFTGVKQMMFHDVIINDNICISTTSFHYLMSINGDIHCWVCDEKINDINGHISTLKHTKLLNEIPVMINEKSEFVREISSELLHCGFCNTTETSWDEMIEHLNSFLHKEVRNAGEWRLQMHLEQIKAENYTRGEISELSISNMLSGLL